MDYRKLDVFKKLKVLVLGDFMLDKYIIGSVKRISPEAPVPVINVQKKEVHLGGAGNVINNIVALGATARIISCVGKDVDGDYLIHRMNEKGVDTRFAWQNENERTIVKTRVSAKGQQFLRYDEEIVKDVDRAYVDYLEQNIEKVFEGIDIVIISDYGKGNVTCDTAQTLIRKAREEDIPVIVDPKGSDYKKYTGATTCTPNMSEFCQVAGCGENLTEEEIAQEAVKICKKISLEYLLVTRSEKGMSLVDEVAGKQDFPTVAREVIDVTGAGDTVISTYSLAIAAGMSREDACILANEAASIVVSKFGSATTTVQEIKAASKDGERSKLVSSDEIEEIVSQLKKKGKKIVFTNGCFDLVHAGHISSFVQAKAKGDVLIVGINSDASIKRIKGDKRPIVTQMNRAKLLSALGMIDYLVIFDDDTPQKLIEKILPDVLVKGKDWEGKEVAGQDVVESHGGKVSFINLEEGLSTTNIIEKIRKLYN